KVEELIKDKNALLQLDQFIYSAIGRGAMPGCQIVALKDGYVIWNKSYGTFDFNEKNLVDNNCLYDIASVTKIAASTLAIMKIYEEGKILLNGALMAYIPEAKG